MNSLRLLQLDPCRFPYIMLTDDHVFIILCIRDGTPQYRTTELTQ